jgi:hypothetical protein
MNKNSQYTYSNGKWCTGCGCNNTRTCISIDEGVMLIVVVAGSHELDGVMHELRPGLINVFASHRAREEAEKKGLGRRPGKSDLMFYRAVRAY